MQKENRFIPLDPKEFEQRGKIEVTRVRVSGANVLGRPFVVPVATNYFDSSQEALEWVQQAPEYSHNFEVPFPQQIAARLAGPRRSTDERLILYSSEKQGESPRTVQDHHGVSTDYETFFDLCINLNPNQHILFDRGLTWINLEEDTPTLKFNILPGLRSTEEMHAGIIQMLFRVNNVLNDLLSGLHS